MHRNRKKMRFRAEKLGISAQNVRKRLAEQWCVNSNDIFIVCFNNIKYALDKWDRIAYNNIRT